METPPFFIFLFIHLASLILGLGAVLVTDLYGLLWLRSRVSFSQLVKVSGVTEIFIWVGWTGMVLTGIPLIIMKGEIDELMILKFFFVILVGLNGVPLHFLHKAMQRVQGSGSVPPRLLFRMTLSIAVSQLGWWGAVVIGFLHRHIWPIIEWPSRPWLVTALIIAGILLIWAAGEGVFNMKRMKGRA